MQRRSFLALGGAAALVLALGGTAAALATSGWRDGRLTPAGRSLFSALGRALLEGSLPAAASAQAAALAGLTDRVETLVAGLPPHAQSEVAQLLALLLAAPGRRLLAGVATPWDEASVPEIQAGLQSMRLSALSARQQAYHALHDIVGGAYFSDPATWALLRYPGPQPVGGAA